MFKKGFAIVYALVNWIMFLGVFVYFAGFLSNFAVPRSIDSGPAVSLGEALAVNIGLLVLFGLQHTIMARPTFKKWWTRFVPPHLERSTYVLLSNLIVVLLFWQWRSTDGLLWKHRKLYGPGDPVRDLWRGVLAHRGVIVLHRPL